MTSGIPETIPCDQGLKFNIRIIKQLMTLHTIELHIV